SAWGCSALFAGFSYYGVVRLLVPVHHRLRLIAFPMRTAVLCERHTTALPRPMLKKEGRRCSP
ncbi:MAG TPA: hypothetical protein VEN78_05535, partial [Bradyrhizobium sp.]|nr:hypothetical protein [Bradyrhizobium sp.]